MSRISILLTGLAFCFCSLTCSFAQAEDNFEKKFWDYLMGNNYKQWSPPPGKNASLYTGQNPHGTLLKIYVNRTAAGDIKGLAQGSIIVLENYLSDRSLKTISVMYRTKGFNPSAHDWYWIEFKPDGTVVESMEKQPQPGLQLASATSETVSAKMTSTKVRLAGKASSCIACHQKASGNDFFYSNDRLDLNTAGKTKLPPAAVSLK